MDFPLFFEAALLGIVEGITEFLPVSSTGHLIFLSDVLGFHAVPGKTFEVVIQLGAILAVLVRYWEKFMGIARTLPRERESQRFVLNILIAFSPAMVLGVVAYPYIKEHFFNSTVVAWALIGGGVAILAIERWIAGKPRRYDSVDDFSPLFALKIGLLQCIAMIPGVSRSGATILGALIAGADRKAAAEFSFFLAIPTLGAASVYTLYKNWAEISTDGLGLILVGFLTSFLTALVVVKWMIAFVSRHGYGPFAWYRIALGTLILLTTAQL